MIHVIEVEQGTPEWSRARAGIPTASEFSTVMAKGQKAGTESKERRKYLLTLAGERLTGETVPGYTNMHMERGKAMEEEARDLYCFQTDHELQRVGFVLNDELKAGVSPDSLIGEDGMLEVKTKLPHLQLAALLANKVPDEHIAQCQGGLFVTGRKWIDFVSYWPKLPLLRIRVERDEDYITMIGYQVAAFNTELDALVKHFEELK
jgi:predicted phage-related endonuclease